MSKLHIALSFALSFLTCNVVSAAEPVELISNGGFEDGLAGWNADAKYELIEKANVAKSGKACLTGEVTGDRQHLTLMRRVPVKTTNRYVLSFWAKATGKTKIVIRAIQPGTDPNIPTVQARKMVSAFDKLPAQWRRYSCPVRVQADGTLELHFIAPSSHGSPPGRIWIDDISLEETVMPAFTSISGGEGFNDEPALAATDDGTLYAAYISFVDDSDSLQVARFRSVADKFQQLGKWQVVGGPKTYILGTTAVAAGDTVWILCASEVEQNWDVYAVRCGKDGPERPIRVTTRPEVDIKPAAAWDENAKRLWVAWESNPKGERSVFLASISNGKASTPERVGQEGFSNYAPSVAIADTVYVAWHSFRDNNYDIYARTRRLDNSAQSAPNSWSPEIRLTKAPMVDRHARLFARDGKLWLLYENTRIGSEKRGYTISRAEYRRLQLAQLTPDMLSSPGLVTPTGARKSARSPESAKHPTRPLTPWDACGSPIVSPVPERGTSSPHASTAGNGNAPAPSRI